MKKFLMTTILFGVTDKKEFARQIVSPFLQRIFIALTILFCMTGGNVSEATPFTDNQFDRIFTGVTKNPAVDSSATFDLNVDTFKEKFNGYATPILKEITGLDDVSAMAHLFLIHDYKIFPMNGVDTFANTFGNVSISIVGVTAPDGGNFKILTCAYTSPEEEDEKLTAQIILEAFVRSVAPDVSAMELMNELTTENSSGSVVKGNVKFSISEDGNLNTLTATPVVN